jgi:hypothetical protein
MVIPDSLGAHALDAALEGLVQASSLDLQEGGVHGGFPSLYESGVRYEREHGTERWLTPSSVLACGVGDCEDLAAWRAAECRVSGEDPYAVARVMRSGPRTWHAVVQHGDGTYEDPSRVLGMGYDVLGSLDDWGIVCEPTRRGGWRCRIARGDSGVVGVAPYGHDALWHAAELANVAGSVGLIPGLDIIARAAQGAMQAALPDVFGPGASLPAASRASSRSPAGSAPRGGGGGEGFSDIARMAETLSRLTRREAQRKVAEERRRAPAAPAATTTRTTTSAAARR